VFFEVAAAASGGWAQAKGSSARTGSVTVSALTQAAPAVQWVAPVTTITGAVINDLVVGDSGAVCYQTVDAATGCISSAGGPVFQTAGNANAGGGAALQPLASPVLLPGGSTLAAMFAYNTTLAVLSATTGGGLLSASVGNASMQVSELGARAARQAGDAAQRA
jgi:hypothetical protein